MSLSWIVEPSPAALAVVGTGVLLPWWLVAVGVAVGAVALAMVARRFARLDAERAWSLRALEEAALSDPLTGLANSRRLMMALRTEVERTQRTGRGFAMLFLDIDNLKAINDTHGHLEGNEVIVRVARVISNCCRAVDTPARYGGDEFAVVLPEADERAAGLVGWRIRKALWNRPASTMVDVSVGVAEYPRDGSTVDMLLASADHAMYTAKAHTASHPRRSSPTPGGTR